MPYSRGPRFYQVSVTGGRVLHNSPSWVPGITRIIGIDLFGTTSSSQLNISLKSTQAAFGSANTALHIGKINVHSGLLGDINAGAADLVGNVTTLANSTVQTIELRRGSVPMHADQRRGERGHVPDRRLPILSANGLINIQGGVSGQFAGSVTLVGGKVILGDDVAGGLNLGGLTISKGGQLIIGNDLDGASTLGVVDLNGGRFLVGHNVNGSLTTDDLVIQNAGQLIVNNDATGSSSTTQSAVSGTDVSGSTSNSSVTSTSTHRNFVATQGSSSRLRTLPAHPGSTRMVFSR